MSYPGDGQRRSARISAPDLACVIDSYYLVARTARKPHSGWVVQSNVHLRRGRSKSCRRDKCRGDALPALAGMVDCRWHTWHCPLLGPAQALDAIMTRNNKPFTRILCHSALVKNAKDSYGVGFARDSDQVAIWDTAVGRQRCESTQAAEQRHRNR
jgi:hypothetical protein